MRVRYLKGAESPDIALTWNDSSGSVIDFSSGYTFEFKIGHGGYNAVFTKTTAITGAATAPNIQIAFLANELSSVPTGLYEAQLRANQTSTNKDRFMNFWFILQSAVT